MKLNAGLKIHLKGYGRRKKTEAITSKTKRVVTALICVRFGNQNIYTSIKLVKNKVIICIGIGTSEYLCSDKL